MSNFLQPLLRNPERVWSLVNEDTGAQLTRHLVAAVDSDTRRRGLLGRTSLDDEGLVIAPCNAVHTFFMKFAIDVIFVDRLGRITRVVPGVGPWRITGAWRGFATIELAAGTAARTATAAGHRLAIREA